jgi:hypothetical protein
VFICSLDFKAKAAAAKDKERKAKERAKGKGKAPGGSGGSSKPLKPVIRTSSYFPRYPSSPDLCPLAEGTRSSAVSDDISLEGLLDNSEEAIREVGVTLNGVSRRLLEIQEMQASIRKRMRGTL